MCGQLRTLTRPRTSALLWEMCWSLSRGTLTNALWVECIWRVEIHAFLLDTKVKWTFDSVKMFNNENLLFSYSLVRSDRWKKWRFPRRAKLVSYFLSQGLKSLLSWLRRSSVMQNDEEIWIKLMSNLSGPSSWMVRQLHHQIPIGLLVQKLQNVLNIDCLSSGEGSQWESEDAAGCRDDGEFPPHLFYTVTTKDLLPGIRETRGQVQIHRPPAVLCNQLPGPAPGKTQCKTNCHVKVITKSRLL